MVCPGLPSVAPPTVRPSPRPDVSPPAAGTFLLYAQGQQIGYLPLNGTRLQKEAAKTLLSLHVKYRRGWGWKGDAGLLDEVTVWVGGQVAELSKNSPFSFLRLLGECVHSSLASLMERNSSAHWEAILSLPKALPFPMLMVILGLALLVQKSLLESKGFSPSWTWVCACSSCWEPCCRGQWEAHSRSPEKDFAGGKGAEHQCPSPHLSVRPRCWLVG